MNIKIVKLRSVDKGNFISSMDILFEDIGLTLAGVKLMNSPQKNENFFSFPSEPYTASDGSKKYKNHAFFEDKDRYFAFQKSMHTALVNYNKEDITKKNKSTDKLLSDNNDNDELPF